MNIFKTPDKYLYTNKALIYLFIPIFVELALEFFVGLADSMRVSSLGEAAISGISLVDFLVKKSPNSSTQLVWFSTLTLAALRIVVIILREFLIGILFGQIEDKLLEKYGDGHS